jgi:hypothetical protein
MYYNRLGLQGFMNGHLYECPNGHLFVIGECGQAMQVRLQIMVTLRAEEQYRISALSKCQLHA